jgi:hemerythrin-like metal-binding protein
LSVGVDEIDIQHMQLVQLINGLHDNILAGEAVETMEKVLDRVIDYTAFHFETEEKLMNQHGYPASDVHIEEHRKLVSTALKLQKIFRSGAGAFTMETISFLQDWLQYHIEQSNKVLGRFLAANGMGKWTES